MKTDARHMRRMVLPVLALIAAMLIAFATAVPAFAATTTTGSTTQKVTITDLVTERFKLTGQSVRFDGEVVGNMMNADRGHKWVLVADGGETISVYMKDADVEQLENFGGYGIVGDKVRIVGVFHVECMTHDSDIDVHATEVKLIEKGGPVEEPASPEPLVPALIVLGIGIVAGIVYWRLRERLR